MGFVLRRMDSLIVVCRLSGSGEYLVPPKHVEVKEESEKVGLTLNIQ